MLKVNSLTGFGGKKSSASLPIEYIGVADSVAGSTSASVSVPSGTADGDLMILRVGRQNGAMSTPSGWTLWTYKASTSGFLAYARLYIFYKYASSEGSTVSFTALSPGYIASISVYRNAVPSAQTPATVAEADATLTLPAVDVTVDGTWGLAFWESHYYDWTWGLVTTNYSTTIATTQATSWGEAYDVDTHSGVFPDGTTSTGTLDFVDNADRKTVGISVTIEPA